MHVSLPKELENLVKDRVQSGLYGSYNEVVLAALREFFHVEKNAIRAEEAGHIRQVVGPRLAAVNDGTADLHDADEVFDEIERGLNH